MNISGYDSLPSKSECQPSGPPNYSNRQPSLPDTEGMDNPYTPLLYSPSRREPTTSRFSTTLLSILLILFLLNCLVTAEAILSTYQSQFASDPPLTALTNEQSWKCTNLGHIQDNAHPSLPALVSRSLSWEKESLEFDLPLDAEGLFLHSRGSLSSGVVRVHQSSEVKDVKVSVTAHAHKKEALASAKVCLVQPDKGGHGIVVLTPFRLVPPRRKNTLFFTINVTFPSPKHPPQDVSSFTADVPRFALDVEDLSGYSFTSFALKSRDRPISVTSVTADTIIVGDRNGKIEGSFSVTQFLKLFTTNGAINASLDVHNNQPKKPTVVFLKSTNGHVHSNISLSTNSSSGTGGDFRVHAHTANAPLDVRITKAPPDSRLHFEGSTKNAPACAALPAAFEGGFLLRTTHFPPALHVSPHVEDPTGRGRVRRVKDRVVAGRAMIGNVSWVPPGERLPVSTADAVADAKAGWASVTTLNAPVRLVL